MEHKLLRYHLDTFVWHKVLLEVGLAIFLVAIIVFAEPASAAMRLQDRSLYMASVEPDATTSYEVSFRYMSATPIGSVDLLICNDPIPYHDCEVPAGFDASNATLTDQAGEMGYSIQSKSVNHIVLTRTAQPILSNASSYTFDNIVNPTDTAKSFSVRLRTHSSVDATGPQVDFGSVKGQVTTGIMLETQVPPMLIFCVSSEVSEDCTSTSAESYSDMGVLSPGSTLTAQSEMAIGTNASGGFAIVVDGSPMSAGTNVIDRLEQLSESVQGQNQFGINLVANDNLGIGHDPQGPWTNAEPTPGYSVPNMFKFVPGDVVADSPNVSLMRKFTVSYVVNSAADLRPGVYTTTLTYVASGRF